MAVLEEREVRAKSDALQKALSAREPTATILNLLKELQKGVKPSEDLLRRTQVGKIVNKVKSQQNIDPAIPRLAAEIISSWRNQIKRPSTSGATSPAQTQNGNTSPAPTSTPTAKPSTSSSPSTDPKLPTGVPLDKRTHKTDSIKKADITPDPARNNSIGLLYNGLVPGSSLPPTQVLSVAKSIELAILSLPAANGTHTSPFYKDKILSLYQNLRNKANPELRVRILDGEVSPDKFATMSHEEMKSEKQKTDDAKIVKENLNNAMVPQEEKSISDHLECGRCKLRKVSFTQAQTRSADEPMTTFCTCTNCGNRWKFS